MNENISNALKYLKELSLAASFKVLIPSLQKEATFKQLNTEQLKQLLETVTDSTPFSFAFNTVFLKVVKDNLIDTDIDINNLNIYDIQYIALYTRLNGLSENYTAYFSNEEIDEYNLTDSKYVVNLQRLLDTKNVNNILSEEITESGVTVICQTPTVYDENEYLNYFNNTIKNSITKDFKKIIGDIFIYEVVKSIKSVTINNEIIDFKSLSFDKKIEVVNQFPTTLTGKIISYIEKYKAALYDLYLIEIETEVEGSRIRLQKQLPYNANLFNY